MFQEPRHRYLLLLAATVLLCGPRLALAGTFVADFTGPALDPLLSKSGSTLRSAPTVTSGGGVLSFAYNSGATYDYGVQKVVTTFNVVGDFVAKVTATVTGKVQAGLEVFYCSDPGAPGKENAYQNANRVAAFLSDGTHTGYIRTASYPGVSYPASGISKVDLYIQRTGYFVDPMFGYGGKEPNSSGAGNSYYYLSLPVTLSLYVANVLGPATVTFSDFEILAASVPDSGPRAASVPEPASMAMFGVGLAALGLLARRPSRRRN